MVDGSRNQYRACCAWSSSRPAPPPSSRPPATRRPPPARRRSSWIYAATRVATSARLSTAPASSWTTRPSTSVSWPTDSASRWRPTTRSRRPTQPLVVLIDQGTASSAEIVSAALKSAGRAELVGDTTFGTGTVLLNFGLPDGSAIRLAVERWLTPDGDLIFGKGIDPTIELAEPISRDPARSERGQSADARTSGDDVRYPASPGPRAVVTNLAGGPVRRCRRWTLRRRLRTRSRRTRRT